jgi:hypothetical protein
MNMDFIAFNCPDPSTNIIVNTYIPTICCGVTISASPCIKDKISFFMSMSCQLHMCTYSSIILNYNNMWKKEYESSFVGQLREILSKSGMRCKSCGMKNEYAEPNQKDGTYMCFNCR